MEPKPSGGVWSLNSLKRPRFGKRQEARKKRQVARYKRIFSSFRLNNKQGKRDW